MMANQDQAVTATVTESLPNQRYGVRLANGRELRAVLSPRFKGRRFEPGQVVTVELFPSDQSLCRIIPGEGEEGVLVRRY